MIIKIEPDSEKAKSIYRMTHERHNFIKTLEITDSSATIIAENYYEIVKEFGTIILLMEGLKATGDYSHREIIEHLGKINILNLEESSLCQDFRVKRNYSSYEGKPISKNYLIEKKSLIESIIQKLKKAVEKRIKI